MCLFFYLISYVISALTYSKSFHMPARGKENATLKRDGTPLPQATLSLLAAYPNWAQIISIKFN